MSGPGLEVGLARSWCLSDAAGGPAAKHTARAAVLAGDEEGGYETVLGRRGCNSECGLDYGRGCDPDFEQMEWKLYFDPQTLNPRDWSRDFGDLYCMWEADCCRDSGRTLCLR